MRVQAGVVQNLDNTRTQINALVSSSQSATGALQAAAVRQPARRAPDQAARRPHRASWRRSRARRAWKARARVENQAQAQQQTHQLPQLRRRAISPAPRRCSTDARPSAQYRRHRAAPPASPWSPRRSSRPRFTSGTTTRRAAAPCHVVRRSERSARRRTGALPGDRHGGEG